MTHDDDRWYYVPPSVHKPGPEPKLLKGIFWGTMAMVPIFIIAACLYKWATGSW